MSWTVVIKDLQTDETLHSYGEFSAKRDAERSAEARMNANMDLEKYYADVEERK